MISFLKDLSPDKLPVIKKTKGPCFVKAGAGTGKTRTIVSKVAYLVESEGLNEERILALTFSNNAASHLKDEVDKLLGYASDVEVGTFHSFCKSILDEYGKRVGIKEGFELITSVDTAIILHEMGLSTYNSKRYTNTIMKSKDLNIGIKDFEKHLNLLKQRVKSFDDDEASWEEHYEDNIVRLRTLHTKSLERGEKSKIKKDLVGFVDAYEEYKKYESFINHWKKYEEIKEERNALDLADLNLRVLELMKQVSNDFLSKNYDYVIVDEFQDTNYVQFELIKKLVNDDKNITVVGDPNQTIYAFRGAYTDNVSEFIKFFELGANNIFSLDTSFRSTQHILDASYELIDNNYADTDESPIKLSSYNDEVGEKVRIYSCLNELEEARKVKEIIDERVKEGVALSSIAVLYRSHKQGSLVKQLLDKRGYPLKIVGGTDLLGLSEVKAVISLLELVNNLENPNYMGDQSWWRILHYENSLTPEDSISLANYVKKNKSSVQEVIFKKLSQLDLSLEGKKIIKNTINKLKELRKHKNEPLTRLVMKSYDLLGLNKFYGDQDLRHKRLILMRDFHQLTKEYQKVHGYSLKNFINYLELYNELGQEHKTESGEENAINLMTIHASKGLEFNTVILVSLAKGHFPLYRGGMLPLIPDELNPQLKKVYEKELEGKELEKEIKIVKKELKLREERKLCYVAMTRAKKRLFMTHAKDYGGSRELKPSEFIQNMGVGTPGDYDNIIYLKDEETIADLGLDTDLEREKKIIINQLLKSLDDNNILTAINHVLTYKSLNGEKITKKELNNNWDIIKPDKRIMRIKQKIKSGVINSLVFDATNFKISASSLKAYNNCPKRFELSKIYRMPTHWDEMTGGAMNKGSFVHKICELAVNEQIKTEKELFKIKDSLLKQPKWEGVKDEEVDLALKVFWERNNHLIKYNLFTEEYFDFMYKDFRFNGVIDRVDKIKNNQVHIIDYKTGGSVSADDALIQLGLYAIAIMNSKKFKEYEPKILTLEMLEQEKPKNYVIKNNIMQLKSGRGKKKTMEEVEELILNLAQSIMHDYTHGFKKNKKECKRCPYKFYCK